MPSHSRRAYLGLLVAVGVTAVSVGAGTFAAPGGTASPLAAAVAKADQAGGKGKAAKGGPDRYDVAGGCYLVRSAATGGYLTRQDDAYALAPAAQAEPVLFQAFDLGKYLLLGRQSDFVATSGDPAAGGVRPATDPVQGAVKGTSDESLNPAREPVLGGTDAVEAGADTATMPLRDAARGTAVVSAAKPSAAAEWVLRDAGKGAFTIAQAVDDNEPANPGPLDPPIARTLTVTADGTLAAAPGDLRDTGSTFTVEKASGCATWTEIDTQVTGPVPTGTSYEQTSGYVDGHLHMMAFEFIGGKARCGRPWHPYGPAYALVDCPDHEPGGRGAALEAVVSGKTPGEGHDTVGWPTFGYWPKYDSLTHEQVYYKWLERSWRGGLRMFTNLLVDNGQLCELYPYKKNSCNEMDGVRLQAQRLHELERYIDAQAGGPGKGWFRIVTDPFEARRVINSGKLAVVMGIEVSVPLDCGEYLGIPRCNTEEMEQRLQEVYDLGVRQMEMTNKFDNGFTGVTGDGGSTGVVVNTGNKGETGHYWKMQTCAEPEGHAEHQHDKQQYNLADESDGNIGRDAIFGAVLEQFGPTGAAPVYPAGPHCNAMGLSDLGRAMLDGMAERGMIFDPDHMSASARRDSLDHLAAQGYSGVISSHSWADDTNYKKILSMGGVITPHAGGTQSFVEKWRKLRTWADERFTFGVGFGSDINGFSTQGGPRNPAAGAGVSYPFTALGGVTVDKQRSGQQTWDINTDGLDHYGLYPDWAEDGRIVAGADGATFAADLARAAEAYLQMWERAIGVEGDSCRADVADLSADDLAAAKRGMSPQRVIATLGQPHTRVGNAFTYCAEGGTATVTFDERERLSSVAVS